MDENKKRKPRVLGPEAKVKLIDKKIAKLKDKIAELELEREEVLKPIQLQQAVEKAMSTMSTEELAAKLGIEVK